jgi:hypothetical protein
VAAFLLLVTVGLCFAYLVGCYEFGKLEGGYATTIPVPQQRSTWRGVVLALGAVSAHALLPLCPFSGWLLGLPVSLAVWGAAVWGDEFFPAANAGRGYSYQELYPVSNKADAAWWECRLTAIAGYFFLTPSYLLAMGIFWTKRAAVLAWLGCFVSHCLTILSR